MVALAFSDTLYKAMLNSMVGGMRCPHSGFHFKAKLIGGDKY
jgi:hypothetical protein